MTQAAETAFSPGRSVSSGLSDMLWGPYPERRSATGKRRGDGSGVLVRLFRPGRPESAIRPGRMRRDLETIDDLRQQLVSNTDEALRRRYRVLGPRLRREGFTRSNLIEALALTAAGAERTLGQTPRDVQLRGAWAMVRGRLAEMETGEGKTLTVALAAACVAAWVEPL